jgi:hypothetical protein
MHIKYTCQAYINKAIYKYGILGSRVVDSDSMTLWILNPDLTSRSKGPKNEGKHVLFSKYYFIFMTER